mmetsp:Transcript_3222/g.3820  ORF Transcript_3222/g.3820 Transcript_3222/m.3820 type:complete len:509 (+) Transcript_3222:141-1667(+)
MESITSSTPMQLFLCTLSGYVVILFYRWLRSLHDPVRVLRHKNSRVWDSCRFADVFHRGYTPPWWLSIGTEMFAGSWHTIAHNIRRGVGEQHNTKYERELLKLSDGGMVGIDWVLESYCPATGETFKSPPLDDERYPIIFLHHGLAGSSDSHYVQSVVNPFLKSQKYRVVCMVARGCGGVPMTTPQGFSAAGSGDIGEALNLIHDRYPSSYVFGVGWSLGGGLLARYIGTEGKRCRLSGACVISPCWDYMARSPYFHFWSRVFLAKSLVDYAKENEYALSKCDRINLKKGLSAVHIEEYDQHMVVPKHDKYTHVNDYYRDASAVHVAKNIHVPTLSINADDDPICSVIGCPDDLSKMGPGLTIVRTKRGGHTCWAKGLDINETWMDEAIVTWINACYDDVIRESKVCHSASAQSGGSKVESATTKVERTGAKLERTETKLEAPPVKKIGDDNSDKKKSSFVKPILNKVETAYSSLQNSGESNEQITTYAAALAVAYCSYRYVRFLKST